MDRKVLHNLSYGVYAITAFDGDKPVGCIANSAMQVTSDPATIAVSINHDNCTNGCIARSGMFAVNIFAEDSKAQIIGTFGYHSSTDTDKFAEVSSHVVGGVPVIEGLLGYMVCKVIGTLESSTHTVFLGEVVEAEMDAGGQPMTYDYYRNVIKGKSPKNAPTYEEEKPAPKPDKAWRCTICGYVYDGVTPFEELPDDWTCPICGVGKTMFEEIDAG